MTEPVRTDPVQTDPPLLREHSEFKSYSAAGYDFPDLRIFYRQRDKINELPTVPQPLPLLVFIHGLGGSAAQFAPLLTSLVPIASCLAIDLPGCGRSAYTETSWAAYTTETLGELLEDIIDEYRDKEAGQRVVLVGHSMGTSLCAYLASRDVQHKTDLVNNISGLVAICPVSGPPPDYQIRRFRAFLWWFPEWLFNLWRRWDRRGGPESTSVRRFVGKNADDESKRLQHIFNSQSRTPVWMRMARGCLPTIKDGVSMGGLPTPEMWQRLDIPIFLVAGRRDKMTPPSNIDNILNHPTQSGGGEAKMSSESDSTASFPPPPSSKKKGGNGAASSDAHKGKAPQAPAQGNNEEPESEPTTPRTPTAPNLTTNEDIPEQPLQPSGVIRSFVMPAPAGHALLYMPMTVRILAGNICDFLSTAVTGRLAYSVCQATRVGVSPEDLF